MGQVSSVPLEYCKSCCFSASAQISSYTRCRTMLCYPTFSGLEGLACTGNICQRLPRRSKVPQISWSVLGIRATVPQHIHISVMPGGFWMIGSGEHARGIAGKDQLLYHVFPHWLYKTSLISIKLHCQTIIL